MKITVLDSYALNPGDLSWDWLYALGEAEIYDRTPAQDIYERVKDADIVLTNKTPMDAELINGLPKLKYVGLLSTGYNIIDCAAAKQRGIPVTNVPAYSTKAVAQLVFAYILHWTNQVSLHSNAVHAGEWSACKDFSFTKAPLTELDGKKIGIIGFGSIGQAVARLAEAFGMEALVYTPHPENKKSTSAVRFVEKDFLLENSDFVTIHCPLTPETNGMANAEFLKKMKPTAYLINTSRGPVVDSAALAQALKSGIIRGAAADVLTAEPPTDGNPLLSCENCIITPHIAWAGFETRERLMSVVKENLETFLSGGLKNAVNL